MTKQEEKKLNEVIKYIEKLEAECLTNYKSEKMDIVKNYYLGYHTSLWNCLEKIKEEFNIKD